jgi:3-oxoacyl-[acyl-carrier protein] reductase
VVQFSTVVEIAVVVSEGQASMEESRHMNLNGSKALVTGASRGIGAAIARTLGAHGADVAITYLESSERATAVVAEIEAAGGRAVALKSDAGNPRSVREAVHAAAEHLGGLDILVNNAGIFPMGPFAEVSMDELDHTMAIHAKSVFVATQAAVEYMKDGGRIVSIGSNLAERVPYEGVVLYSMSKAALVGFTRAAARELGPRGITVNLVHPGSTATEMNPPDAPEADGERALMALGRYADPTDIAATVLHLVGPGGQQITGVSIAVDGGANA